MRTGYHSVDLTTVTQVKVHPGDMLAWLSSNHTGKIAFVGKTSNVEGRAFEGILDGSVKDQTFGPGLQSVAFSLSFALSAYVTPLSFFDVTFNLDNWVGIHPVLLTLSDSFGNTEASSEELLQQRAITGLTLNLPEFALVGNLSLGSSITNGTNVTYIWHFGENQTTEIFNVTSVIHAFTSSGVQNLSVTASNEVAVAQSECFGRPYLLYGVKKLTISHLLPTMVNENLTIVVSLAQGSLVDLNISLGDGSPDFNLTKIDVKDNFVVAINHSYSSAGVFTVQAFARNFLSNASALRNITVQWPILGLNVSAPQGVHSSDKDLAINVSVRQGTDVHCKVTLDLNLMSVTFEPSVQLRTAFGHFFMVVIPKEMLTPSIAKLTVNTFNLVSRNESSTDIMIVRPITKASLQLVSSSGAMETRKPATFVFYYETGSNLTITFWKDLAAESTNVQPPGEGNYRSVKSSDFIYPDSGVYTARVNYSNPLGFVVIEGTVIVQEPVKDIDAFTLSFIPLPPGIVNVVVKQNVTLATNATVVCSYGDGSIQSLDLTSDFNVSHRCVNIMCNE